MTSARLTFGAVLGTVTDTAAMVSNTVNTVSGAVNMANRFVESASTDQKDRQVIHRKTFRDTLLRDARIEIARSNAEVLSFVNESEQNKVLFTQAQEYLPDSIFES